MLISDIESVHTNQNQFALQPRIVKRLPNLKLPIARADDYRFAMHKI